MGKISRIQLRGISRNPSDRITDDGGCADSLNAYISDSEIAPINAAVPCNDEFGLKQDGTSYEPVYVHKTNEYEHFIVHNRTHGELAYVSNDVYTPILQTRDDINKITHVGNTLVIATSSQVVFFLFRDGKYMMINLNEEILPKLSFVNVNQPNGGKDGVTYDVWSYDQYESDWNVMPNGNPTRNYEVTDEQQKDALSKLWQTYRAMIDNNKALGCFSEPVMLRYAVRMFDGSYLWTSPPIMVGSSLTKDIDPTIPFGNFGNVSTPVNAFIANKHDTRSSQTYIQLATPYKIGVNFYRTDYINSLKDIISSIDVFMSAPIDFYPDGETKVKGEYDKTVSDDYYNSCYRLTFDPVNSEDPKKIEDAVLSASTFFLAKRYMLEDIPEGMDILSDDFLGENLFTKERFDDSKIATFIANAQSVGSYNSRLIAVGYDEIISRGIGVLNGQHANAFESVAEDVLTNVTYAFAYHISGKNLIIRDMDAKSGGSAYRMAPDVGKGSMDRNEIVDTLSTPYAWISHPDPECTKVSIRMYNEGVLVSGYELEMKPHPFLSCSYAFLGIGNRIYKADMEGKGDIDNYTDKPIAKNRNKVAISTSANPFAFALTGRLTFGSDVRALAIASEPMSVGQFGQFPIYFFADDGIYTTEITPDGNFGSRPTFVSGDVCSSPSKIVPTKDTVFFMSRRGLIGISGRQTICVSEHMNGHAYNIPEEILPLIELADFEGMADKDVPVESFGNYMHRSGTKIAYDYEGERLICFNSAYDYQYAYSLKTQTWHRTKYGKLSTVLNLYPRCIITQMSSRRQGDVIVTTYPLMDISLVNDPSIPPKKIMVVSRPFDLQEPDVLKTITDVRVRGSFAKGAVKFILEGSQDGINFYTISTLRGKAWKMFRIIILGNLDVYERISWIDIMYDSRFTNRLR